MTHAGLAYKVGLTAPTRYAYTVGIATETTEDQMTRKLTAKDLTDKQLRTAATSPISTKKMRDDAKAELNTRKGALAVIADQPKD